MGSSLRHAGSFVAARGLFVDVHGLLSSCGMQVPERVGSVVCSMPALSLRQVSSVVVVCRLSCPAARGILVP